MRTAPRDPLCEAVDLAEAKTRALADPLVVKNGSKARAITSAGMPGPLSATERTMYSPPANSASSAMFSKRDSIVTRPPFGMASRELIARLRTAISSCVRSDNTDGASVLQVEAHFDHRAQRAIDQVRHCPDEVRNVDGDELQSCERENVRSCEVRRAPRSAAWSAASAKRTTLFESVGLRRMSSRLPVSAARRLLKSCAMPPVNWPTLPSSAPAATALPRFRASPPAAFRR